MNRDIVLGGDSEIVDSIETMFLRWRARPVRTKGIEALRRAISRDDGEPDLVVICAASGKPGRADPLVRAAQAVAREIPLIVVAGPGAAGSIDRSDPASPPVLVAPVNAGSLRALAEHLLRRP